MLGVLVHAEIPAFRRLEHKVSCEFAASPNYTARSYLNNSKRAAFLRLTFWSFPGFPVAGLGILHLTNSLRHLAASHFPSSMEPAVVLLSFTTEDAPMWSFLRATCKEPGLIARHKGLVRASPCPCLSLSPSQSLSRHTGPSLGPYHFANGT